MYNFKKKNFIPESQFPLSLSAISNWNALNENANIGHVSGEPYYSLKYCFCCWRWRCGGCGWCCWLFPANENSTAADRYVTWMFCSTSLLRQIERVETWNAILYIVGFIDCAYLRDTGKHLRWCEKFQWFSHFHMCDSWNDNDYENKERKKLTTIKLSEDGLEYSIDVRMGAKRKKTSKKIQFNL